MTDRDRKNTPNRDSLTEWREITEREAFQKILASVSDFYEIMDRLNPRDTYREPELHHLRRALECASVNDVYFYARRHPDDTCIFAIVGGLETTYGETVTAWVHQDGIMRERIVTPAASNPAHTIPCLTDIFKGAPALSTLTLRLTPLANQLIARVNADLAEEKS